MSGSLINIHDDRLSKPELDFTAACDEKIPECQKLAKEGKIHDAIDILLSLEKQTRSSADMISNSRILIAIVQICFEAKKWNLLNEYILELSKRRSQLKQAIAKMVQECCTYVDKTPNKEIKVQLIETLRNVTEGKIYVEVERARLTHKLAMIKEEEGNITEAADIIQELQMETYGSMEKKEKVELILEQIRLSLAKKDYIRTQIISKKVTTKFFEDEKNQELKLKYYRLMIELDDHESSFLATCKHYRAILNTPSIQENEKQRKAMLQNVIIYLVLAPYDNEQADLSHRVLKDPLIDEVPKYKEILKMFITPEIIHWSILVTSYESYLKTDKSATGIFNPQTEKGVSRWNELKTRVVEHNIQVMAKYYTRMTLMSMAQLLGLPVNETEEVLANLVVKKTVEAKIDRPAGIVWFTRSKDPSDILNEWSNRLNTLMQLVNKTTHLMNKEETLHHHLVMSQESF